MRKREQKENQAARVVVGRIVVKMNRQGWEKGMKDGGTTALLPYSLFVLCGDRRNVSEREQGQ